MEGQGAGRGDARDGEGQACQGSGLEAAPGRAQGQAHQARGDQWLAVRFPGVGPPLAVPVQRPPLAGDGPSAQPRLSAPFLKPGLIALDVRRRVLHVGEAGGGLSGDPGQALDRRRRVLLVMVRRCLGLGLEQRRREREIVRHCAKHTRTAPQRVWGSVRESRGYLAGARAKSAVNVERGGAGMVHGGGGGERPAGCVWRSRGVFADLAGLG